MSSQTARQRHTNWNSPVTHLAAIAAVYGLMSPRSAAHRVLDRNLCWCRASHEHASRSARARPSSASSAPAFAKLLRAFDSAWLQYLEQFVAWKSADAATLEVDALA